MNSNTPKPPLKTNRSFWGLAVAQSLGALNDNLFKQIVLLVFVAVPVAGGGTKDIQYLATIVFSIPFVLFSGIAGYFSDRGSKSRVIVRCKIAEIMITLVGVGVLLMYSRNGISTAFVAMLAAVLFGFGTQSAFFGPGKYGVLPEILEDRDLPGANGIIVMLTFISIILGMASAGWLMDLFGDRLWQPGMVCVGIAIVGTIASFTIRKTEPANKDLKFDATTLTIPRDIRQLLRVDRTLAIALFVSCIFWMVAAIVQQAVNGFGKHQLQLDRDALISYLVATISLGVAVGAVICGWVSQGRVRWGLLRLGAFGITACLVALSIQHNGQHWLGYRGSLVTLTILGVFTGMFAIPIQVFLQARPPQSLRGQLIATQNFVNWIAIIFAGAIYGAFGLLVRIQQWPQSVIFLLTAMIMLPVALFFRPSDTTEGFNSDTAVRPAESPTELSSSE